ncbi:MAG TPA: Asp-tRNA(Asn)/Glu-tRNA(Gln) amidotransferase subunit GatB [Candidatus Egerieicola pullicola]|uniref:Aspartyl/glutamyl-tRNA(Asn/Gln) amidotransferase subunit B n=1 Tax=Candidatus Egerieicola pullicola TaxID=2840775 RepID=A0A9D1AM87_9FIRM|nr:Asp-tRNA(Asn)/Glu-tRNA(Gln) amidotransferase subunit GatB [Candidatus Egerieicola pullicola]
MSWELVSGLETHVELSTKTKIFCGCTTKFGGEPNTNCCPICIGLPGTLPKLNRQVVHYAIMAGLATHCTINNISKMDRKNYVYPDLPKAYQISQYDKPLCEHGYIQLSNGRKIGITRIHIEEDAGKLVHEHGDTYVDYNRGGVPLIEIVSEPDIRSIAEAREYVEKLQMIMKHIGVSDCKMQEGSLRCDVNISVRPQGSEEFGTRTEIKNMNSFTNMEKAMAYEYDRQIDLLESGGKVTQETLRWNPDEGITTPMRGKEDAHDYRYFREPDLVTIYTTDQEIEAIRQELPELPDARIARYQEEFGLPAADAQLLVKYRKIAEYFEAASEGLSNKKTVANFILGQIFRTLVTDEEKENGAVAIPPEYLHDLAKLLEDGKIKMNLAKTTLDKMLETKKPCTDFISEQDMGDIDEDTLRSICQSVVEQNPKAVADFKGGKDKAVKALIGQVMKQTRGKADGRKAEALMVEMMNAMD